MSAIFANIKQVITGNQKIDEKWAYSRICYCISFVHLVITCVFYYYGVYILGIYNTAITIAYAWFGFSVIRRQKYRQAYFFSFFEILFHSVFATLLVGWEWGFMIYTISLVAVSFYFALTRNKFSHRVIYPFCASALITIIFITTYIICKVIDAPYRDIAPQNFIAGYYCFNSFIAVLMCFIFSMMFSLEVWYMQKQLMKENITLDEMASRDPLTKLLNRRSMETHLNRVMEHAISTGDNFCLVMGDIDNFKKINDTYGHDYGDKVLVAVSETLCEEMRSDDQICRWGGEEFLLLVHTTQECCISTANRICEAISKIHVTDAQYDISVTMTFGVSSYIPGCDMEKLIQIADQNLYKGKKNGKNQVVF